MIQEQVVNEDGTPFGRYRLIELIGRGGMGEVWRAYDTETQRVVAVKVLPANLANDPTFVERFRREALAAAGLNDPHVVPIHNFGEIDGRLYVDMRLINGRDLQSIIAEGAMEPARAVAIIEQIASALHDAHRIGLVHRDVKPSNILVAENDFAYLIDFGIARAAGRIADDRHRQRDRHLGLHGAGTAEQRADRPSQRHLRPRVRLARVPDGQPAVPGDKHRTTNRRPPGAAAAPAVNSAAGLPAQLDAVIATGMAKNPDQRYSTPTEMAAAARAAITQPPTALPRLAARC